MEKLNHRLEQVKMVDDTISRAIRRGDQDTFKKYNTVRGYLIDDIRVLYQIPGISIFVLDPVRTRIRKLLGIRE
jgi:hypothetical protein